MTRSRTAPCGRTKKRLALVGAAGFATLLVVSLLQAGNATADAGSGGSSSVPASSVVADSSSAATTTAAAAVAAAYGHRVEVISADTEASTTYVNPDGTQTAALTAQPTRVRINGTLEPIDLNLAAQSDGTWAPATSAVNVDLGGGGSAVIAKVGLGAGTVTYSWSARLPAPTIAAQSATYANVLPNTDLKVTVSNFGFETFLVVKSRPTVALGTLSLPVTLSGITATTNADGSISYTDGASGSTVATAAAPTVWDASIDPTTGDPHSAGMTQTLTALTGGPLPKGSPKAGVPLGATQTLSIPQSIFDDPSTVYPVTVDPELVQGSGEAAYTYVDSGAPTANNYDTSFDSSQLHMGLDPSGATSVNRAMWWFAGLASLQTGTANVLTATFSAGLTWTAGCAAEPIQLGWTNPWANGTTWNTQPAWSGAVTTVSPPSANTQSCGAGHSQSSVGFDATYMMQQLATQRWANYYIQLRAANESVWQQWQKFNWNASLTITFVTTPNLPTSASFVSPTQPCVSSAANPATLPHVNLNYAATFQAVYGTNYDNGYVNAGFVLYPTSQGGTWLWASNDINSPSNQTASTTIPPNVAGIVQGDVYDLQSYGWESTSSWPNVIGPPLNCYFVADNSVPSTPQLSGTVPVSTVGKPVTLTFTTPASGSVAGIRYQWASSDFPLQAALQPTPAAGTSYSVSGTVYTYKPVTVGVAPSVVVAPIQQGASTLYVQFVNQAGTASASLLVSFNATSDSAGGKSTPGGGGISANWPSHGWPVPTGTPTSVTDFGNLAATPGDASPMTLTGVSTTAAGTATATPNTPALTFAGPYTGTYNNSTAIATVATGTNLTVPYTSTSTGFSIGAWVDPTTTGDQFHHSVMSQEGTYNSGFFLRTSYTATPTNPATPTLWEFCLVESNTTDGRPFSCVDSTNSPVVVGQWAFVAATWDPVNLQIRLHVVSLSGTVAIDTVYTAPAAMPAAPATGPVVVGRDQWAGLGGDYDAFAGQIAAPFLALGDVTTSQVLTQYSRTSN